MSSHPCIGNQGLNKESALGGNGCSRNDGSKTQYYVVILDRLQGHSGGLEQAPESWIRGPLTAGAKRTCCSSPAPNA